MRETDVKCRRDVESFSSLEDIVNGTNEFFLLLYQKSSLISSSDASYRSPLLFSATKQQRNTTTIVSVPFGQKELIYAFVTYILDDGNI